MISREVGILDEKSCGSIAAMQSKADVIIGGQKLQGRLSRESEDNLKIQPDTAQNAKLLIQARPPFPAACFLGFAGELARPLLQQPFFRPSGSC